MIKQYKSYQHIERLGTDDTDGILIGECYIFPKIDGTNGCLWWDGGLKAGSRKRELATDDDNQGFYNWALKNKKIERFFEKYPDVILYGEWMVPHTLKTYRPDTWNRFFIFDIIDDYSYVPYPVYKEWLDEFELDYIPPLIRISNPSMERIHHQLEQNTFMIEEGNGVGEGVVIKNYDYTNRFGRKTWAKVVRNEYKDMHRKDSITDVKDKDRVEELIVNKYITQSFVDKEFDKIKSKDGWSSSFIPRLLSSVYHEFITEEMWHILKDFKNPVIDFKLLNQLVIHRIKQLKGELF